MKSKPDPRVEMCQEYYDVLIAALRHVAYRCGYALGVHGSLRRDIDLIAAPWRDSAISAESLIKHLRETAEAVIGHAEMSDFNNGRPEKKPAGRLAFSIHLTHWKESGAYLDISVMPMVLWEDKFTGENGDGI